MSSLACHKGCVWRYCNRLDAVQEGVAAIPLRVLRARPVVMSIGAGFFSSNLPFQTRHTASKCARIFLVYLSRHFTSAKSRA